MLDPRIYRTGMVAVALALIVCAFSLHDLPLPLGTTMAPGAFNGSAAYATMFALAARGPDRRPESRADREIADYVAARLKAYGFAVTASKFRARTVAGARTIENVTGTLAGSSALAIVIVAPRDGAGAPAAAGLSGTAVLLELARVLSSQTQRHTIVVASLSASAGGAGSAQLARDLPQPVDAALALGDLASPRAAQLAIVPWSLDGAQAPPALRQTVAASLAAQAQPTGAGAGLGSQVLRQAFPMSLSVQAPLNRSGDPAVLITRSPEDRTRLPEDRTRLPEDPTRLPEDPTRLPEDRTRSSAHRPAPAALAGPGQAQTAQPTIAAMGRALLQTVDGLDAGGEVARPSAHLVIGGKVLDAGPIRLLVLALIVPVALALLDACARVRRRGEPLLAGIVGAVSAASAFVLAALMVAVAALAGLLSGAPAGPVPAGTAPPGAGGVATMALALVVALGGLLWLRPRLGALAGAQAVGGEAGAVAVLTVLCVVVLGLWAFNPLAALTLVPALHLWIWLGVEIRWPRLAKLGLWSLGLAVPALAVVYYAASAHLGVFDVIWNGVLMIAGGQLTSAGVMLWSVAFGCFVSVLGLAWRAPGEPLTRSVAITVRGPLSYAGRGAVGGTDSALRR